MTPRAVKRWIGGLVAALRAANADRQTTASPRRTRRRRRGSARSVERSGAHGVQVSHKMSRSVLRLFPPSSGEDAIAERQPTLLEDRGRLPQRHVDQYRRGADVGLGKHRRKQDGSVRGVGNRRTRQSQQCRFDGVTVGRVGASHADALGTDGSNESASPVRDAGWRVSVTLKQSEILKVHAASSACPKSQDGSSCLQVSGWVGAARWCRGAGGRRSRSRTGSRCFHRGGNSRESTRRVRLNRWACSSARRSP